MTDCTDVRQHLIDEGLDAVREQRTLAEHLHECESCHALLDAYAATPDLLGELPDYEPSEALIASTLEVVQAAADPKTPGARWNRRTAMTMGTGMVILAVFGLSTQYLLLPEASEPRPRASLMLDNKPDANVGQTDKDEIVGGGRSNFRNESASGINLAAGDDQSAAKGVANGALVSPVDEVLPETEPEPRFERRLGDEFDRGAYEANDLRIAARPILSPPRSDEDGLDMEFLAQSANARSKEDLPKPTVIPQGQFERERQLAEISKQLSQSYPESVEPPRVGAKQRRAELDFEQKNQDLSDIQEIIVTGSRAKRTDVGHFEFLEHYQQTRDLHYQAAEGYWANNYVPGDPQIRLLAARLARWDRTALDESWRLEQDVTPIKQPFDAPENNALALTVMGDANAIDGPTRMRLQVGIRGIEHLRGRRPAMNLAIVVDLPDDADDSVRIASRALLDALLDSKQSGDRFSLVVNGGDDSLVVAPEDFRFGPLQLATQTILGEQSGTNRGRLLDAVGRATEMVKAGDDPSRPLGSSAILLITAATLTEVDALANFAHSQARDGVTFSVFPLGEKPRSADVETVVLAGLGNRRYLTSPDRARALVEDELHASSQAVARAARLSIQLAPGVQLVEVIGSERLETVESERVKEIETAMDQRLRHNLGIEADRGDDEGGIQIIIPSVFANDSLTVLIDVVVDQPGPIADVSLRYKDLVFKKNGTLRSHFALAEGELNRGPAELAVLKNLLAHHFSLSVTQAAEALAQEQFELATTELASARSTLSQLRSQINAWEDDPELLRDQQILERYLRVLTTSEAHSRQLLLADSLRYAAWAKAHRPSACNVDERCTPAE